MCVVLCSGRPIVRNTLPPESSGSMNWSARCFRCTVLELLNPAKYLGDGFEGIFCKISKGKYESNLPLIDLYFPEASFGFQLIDDYWYWFWN